MKIINNNTLQLIKELSHNPCIGLEVEFYTKKKYIYINHTKHNIISDHQFFTIKPESCENQYEIIFQHTQDIKQIQQYQNIINDIIRDNPHCIFASQYENVYNGVHLNISIPFQSRKKLFTIAEYICIFIHHNIDIFLYKNSRLIESRSIFTPKHITWGPNNRLNAVRINKNRIEIRLFAIDSPIFLVINRLLLIQSSITEELPFKYGPYYGSTLPEHLKISYMKKYINH